MKKLITAILSLVSVLSFFMLFDEAKINSVDNIKSLESSLNNSYRILMPNMISMADQKYIYNKLTKCLDRYHANIYYSKVEVQNVNGRDIERETKYIYFNNLDYFKKLSMSEGRGLKSEEKESKLFLSTRKTGKSNQIGRIASIDKDNPIEVHTLLELVDNGGFLDGYCYIQLPKDADIDEFTIDLEKSIKIGGVKALDDINNVHESYEISYKWVVILGLYFFCMLMMIYDILKSYREISIKKMLGFSKNTIYLSNLKNLVLIQIGVQAIITIILSLIQFDNYNKYVYMFFKNLIGAYVVELAVLIVVASIPYIYINKIKISDMLKNKQPTREVLIFNNGIKIILIVGFFMVANFMIKDFSSFKNLYSKSFAKWEETKDYVVLPTLTGYKVNEYLLSEKSFDEQKQIYTYFNEKGALLADFCEFTDGIRRIRLAETKYPYESDNVWVNPNYLKLNPIYDINGKTVQVSEQADTEVILVPEKYKKYEKDIINKHKLWNNDWNRSSWGKSDPKTNRDIKIIWIKNGQSIFTYNLEINTDKGNCLMDVFINVLTENNGLKFEYSKMFAYSGNPFKIKLDSKLSIEENVKPELNKYGYLKYVPYIERVDSSVKAEGNKIKEKMSIYLGITSLIIIGLIFILMQNVVTFFNQYKQHIAIRHMHGYGSFQKYKEYFSLALVSWLVISVGIYISGKVNLYIQLNLSAVLILFEIILSLIMLAFTNKKNITSVVKGN